MSLLYAQHVIVFYFLRYVQKGETETFAFHDTVLNLCLQLSLCYDICM